MKQKRKLTSFASIAVMVLIAVLNPKAIAEPLAPAPPMGWNSYDSYCDSVTEAEVVTNAACLKQTLAKHGWQYVVVDFRWYDPKPTACDWMLNPTRTGAALTADECGRLSPATNRFPSAADGRGFTALAAKIHGMGLKFGIHVMRGIPRQAVRLNTPIEGGQFTAGDAAQTNSICPWCPDMFGVKANAAGQAWYDSIFRQYASWGVDFVKVDDLSEPYYGNEIEMIHQAIGRCGRPMVLSTSPGPTSVAHADHVRTNAQMWRISSDFWDRWEKLNELFDLFANWQGVGGPGHWPDGDMIPLGRISIRSPVGGADHYTRFTKGEQRMLMTMLCIAPSPLMLGMNLPDNDDWTSSLLTNDEALAVNQDPLGAPAKKISSKDGVEIWVKPLRDGSRAVGIFNRAETGHIDENRAAFRSPIIAGATSGLVKIDVDVSLAKKLWLLVGDANNGIGYDQADWIEPKLATATGEKRLTDLKWKSATAGWGEVHVNRSVSGGELKVSDAVFTNGIGTHSISLIEYDLPEGCTRFTAQAGLDASGVSQPGSTSSVQFFVFTQEPFVTNPPANVSISFSDLGLHGKRTVRDLWQHADITASETYNTSIAPHSCVFLRVK